MAISSTDLKFRPMPKRFSRPLVVAALFGSLVANSQSVPTAPNQVQGTWRLVSAVIDPDGRKVPAYGARPNGLLIFTPDLHYSVVITSADTPRFASNERGQGTDAENRRAMSSSIGFFGTYTVDENGAFSGNRVAAATFPNWVGSVRTTKELRLVVSGDRLIEDFQRPDGTKIRIVWERARLE